MLKKQLKKISKINKINKIHKINKIAKISKFKKILKKGFTIKKKSDTVYLNNIMVPENYSLKNVGLSQSLITAFMCCPFRFLLKLNRWRSIEDNYITSFGSLVHYGLDKLYSRVNYRILQHKDDLYDFISELPYLYEQEEPGRIVGITEENKANQIAVFTVMMEEYVRIYGSDLLNKQFLDVEREIENKTTSCKYVLKIDGRFKQNKTQSHWLMEHKTRGKISEENLMLRLTMDFQNLFYSVNFEDIEKFKLRGVLYNVIRTPSMSRRKGRGKKKTGAETLPEFCSRLRADVTKRPSHYFKRYEIPYSTFDKVVFKRRLDAIVNDIKIKIKHCKENHSNIVFWKNDCACESPYPCRFLPACACGNLNGYLQSEKLFAELDTIED